LRWYSNQGNGPAHPLQRQASEGRALSPGYAGAEAQGIYTTAGDASQPQPSPCRRRADREPERSEAPGLQRERTMVRELLPVCLAKGTSEEGRGAWRSSRNRNL
jgi:hypothetical protein